MKYLCTIACLTLFLSACHHHDDPEPEPQTPNRTVLIYIAGENNLSSFIEEELQEMRKGSQNVNIDNLILYVDASDGSTPPYMVRYQKGLSTDSTSWEESYASDPYVIYKVLMATIEKYPANDYGLVLWGHASGWRFENDTTAYTSVIGARSSKPRKAYGIDNGKNTESNVGKWINMPTLAKVLQRTGHRLKFIFADCCQFQCIESAYELRNTCDYLIASPAEIPGVGAPYDTMVPAMFSTSPTFYQQMVDAYYAQTSYGYKEPLSVIKTSELDALATATGNALMTFADKLATEDNPYPDMNGIIYYQGSSYGTYHYMYDMNDFMLHYAASSDYTLWKQAFDRAIIYKTPTLELDGKWMSNNQNAINFNSFLLDDTHYGGVSMFVPQYPYTYTYYYSYNKDIQKTAWYHAASLASLNW